MQLASTIRFDDSSMRFLKEGTEVGSDYGLIGGCATWYCLYKLITGIRKIDVVWWLNLFALLNLFIICVFVGWGLWGSRYFISTFMVWSVLLTIAVEESKYSIIKYLFRFFIVVSILLTTVCSFNKRPIDIYNSIYNRIMEMTQENITVQPIINDIISLTNSTNKLRLGLSPGLDAWTLPFFDLKNVTIIPTSTNSDITVYKGKVDCILYLVKEPSSEELKHLKLIKKYYGGGGFWGRSSSIYVYN
jgi:hypothetical protein